VLARQAASTLKRLPTAKFRSVFSTSPTVSPEGRTAPPSIVRLQRRWRSATVRAPAASVDFFKRVLAGVTTSEVGDTECGAARVCGGPRLLLPGYASWAEAVVFAVAV